jgi:hypothetical protein
MVKGIPIDSGEKSHPGASWERKEGVIEWEERKKVIRRLKA